MRTVTCSSLPRIWAPNRRYLIIARSEDDVRVVERITAQGVSGLSVATIAGVSFPTNLPTVALQDEPLYEDDIVAVAPRQQQVHVLLRSRDLHHTVFLTNRCNSLCLMCSQPPSKQDDSWLVQEAKDICRHISVAPQTIGFTGGEPLLLGGQLREILDTYRSLLPDTRFDVLTNGRLFSDPALAQFLLADLDRVTWMVPLYGHADFLHDFIVQSHGAFDQTISGLLELQAHQQPIQLRIVLIQPILSWLPQLCSFIARNLPFVQEVALMGCEPTGFALANKDLCRVDMGDWASTLEGAVDTLTRYGLQPVLMNLPLCALPRNIRRYAHRSISDWKQTYAEECSKCSAKDDCSGLFAWHERGWKPTKLTAITEENHEAI
jgi:His-Xaa-Ser system radical SAM maturase HxsC